jgi:hypothetical protein
MAQFGRPTSTVTTGSWAATGGPASLWDCLNESSFSDSDYIRSSGASASACEVAISSLTAPTDKTNHIIRIRMRAAGSGGAENLQVALYQGATLIAQSGNLSNRSASFAERTFTLTSTQAGNITDYSNLRIRLIPSHANGETIDVSWAEFETPDASTQHTSSPSDTLTLADAATKSTTKARTDTLTLADAIAKDVAKVASDSLTLTDQISKALTKALADAVSFNDNSSRQIVITLELSDGVTFTEAVVKAVSKEVADSISMIDGVSKEARITPADLVSFTDATSKSTSKSLADAVTLQESRTKEVSITRADVIDYSDEVTKSLAITAADAITLNDSVSKDISTVHSDAMTLSDSVAKDFDKSLEDDISIEDLFDADLIQEGGGITHEKDLDDIVTFNDDQERSVLYALSLSDSVTLLDSAAAAIAQETSAPPFELPGSIMTEIAFRSPVATSILKSTINTTITLKSNITI